MSVRKFFALSREKYLSFGKGQRYMSQFVTATKSTETDKKVNGNSEKTFTQLAEHRFIYPEFLPDPRYEFRHKVKEKLEREDMLKRRAVMSIPEFYVGSILAVTASDPYAPGKEIRFVGICVQRKYNGLRSTFILRNVIDGQGVEVMYEMYNPTLLSVEVLRLEKRLDDELLYLRDAPLEHSTFPFDMEPEFIPANEPVPINTMKVKLKPYPWHQRWEKKYLKGIEELEGLPTIRLEVFKNNETPWEKYDLMKEYRRCIPEEDQEEIWQDVDSHWKKQPPRKQLWKKTLQKAKPKKSF